MVKRALNPNDIYARTEYDADNDVYIIYPTGHLETPADVEAWFASVQVRQLAERYDAILVLEMFSISPAVAQLYQERITYINENIVRYYVLVDLSADLARTMQAGAKQLSPMGFAPDIPSAIEVLKKIRRDHA